MLNQLKLIVDELLEFGTRNISPRSFTFEQVFYRPPKPSFSQFAWVTAQVLAIAHVS